MKSQKINLVVEIEVAEVKVLEVVNVAKEALVVKDVKEDLEVSAVKVVSEEVPDVKEASVEVNVEKKERKVLVDLEVAIVTEAVALVVVEVETEETLVVDLVTEASEVEMKEVLALVAETTEVEATEVLVEAEEVLVNHLVKEKVVFKK